MKDLQPTDLRNVSWLTFRNASGSTIPAWGVFRVAQGERDSNDMFQIIGVANNEFGSRYHHYVNGPVPVIDGAYGQCLIPYKPIPVRYLLTEATPPQIGDAVGPRAGDFTLHINTGGFIVIGPRDDTNGIVWVERCPFDFCDAIAQGDVSQGASGNCNVFSAGDTGHAINVLARYGGWETGQHVACKWDYLNKVWTGIQKECD